MSKLKELIEELCPNGVEYKPLWKVTIWDKKFNGVDKSKQIKVISYKYYLSSDFAKVERKNGNIKYICTGISGEERYTTEELAGDYLSEGEVVCIPWGGKPNVKYYNGKFVTGDNRIATSLDTRVLNNKFLYYWMQSKINIISKFYRGSGIKHPSMKDILDIQIPVPPLEVQCEIVRILDRFTELEVEFEAKLEAELEARRKQYEYYRDKILNFDDTGNPCNCTHTHTHTHGYFYKQKIKWKKLEEICDLSAGGDINKEDVKKEKTKEYSIPVLSNGIGDNALYGYTNIVRIAAPCITISARGTIGYCELRKENFYPIVRLICVKPKTDEINIEFLKYYIQTIKFKTPTSGISQLTVPMTKSYQIPIPTIEEQEKIANVLDRFEKLCNDISEGLSAEIEIRKKQYEYYRDKLLTFKELKVEN